MIRVSVTTLEKFRRYMTEASPYDTEESLIESIKGTFKGNDKTKFGEAYHKILEGDYQHAAARVFAGDFNFAYNTARPGIEYRKAHPLIVPEVPMRKTYLTYYFPVQVSGKVDAIEGRLIRDSKLRFSNYHVTDYLDSCQWKFYCDMFELDSFIYDIFQVRGFDALPPDPPYSIDVQIDDPVDIRCERYDNMIPDIMSILNEFLHYVHERNLFGFLKPAIEEQVFI